MDKMDKKDLCSSSPANGNNGKHHHHGTHHKTEPDFLYWYPEYSPEGKGALVSSLDILKEKKRLFITVFLVLLGWLSFNIMFGFKETYTSTAKVLVKDSVITSRYVANTIDSEAQRTTSSSNSNPVLNMMELLYSDAISTRLYFYLRRNHPEQLKALKITTLSDWFAYYKDGSPFVKVKNKAGTDIISMKFTWTDPKTARSAMKALLSTFRSVSLELNRQEQRERAHYLKIQLAKVGEQLEEVRQRKSAMKSRLTSLSFREQERVLEENRLELQKQLDLAIAQAQAKRSEHRVYRKVLGLNSQSAIQASSLGLNRHLAELKERLYELNQRYAHDSRIQAPTNPQLIALKAEIEQTRKDIAGEVDASAIRGATGQMISDDATAGVITKMVSAEAEAASYGGQARKLAQAKVRLEEQMRKAPLNELRLRAIEEDEAALSRASDALRQGLIEARLKEAQTLSNIFPIDNPSFPLKPDFPHAWHLLVLGIAVSLGTAFGVAFIAHKMENALKRTHTAMEPAASKNNGHARLHSHADAEPVKV